MFINVYHKKYNFGHVFICKLKFGRQPCLMVRFSLGDPSKTYFWSKSALKICKHWNISYCLISTPFPSHNPLHSIFYKQNQGKINFKS